MGYIIVFMIMLLMVFLGFIVALMYLSNSQNEAKEISIKKRVEGEGETELEREEILPEEPSKEQPSKKTAAEVVLELTEQPSYTEAESEYEEVDERELIEARMHLQDKKFEI